MLGRRMQMGAAGVDGGGGTPTEVAFDPNDKHADISLSNGNKTASNSTGTWRAVRGNSSKTSGKWYFEFQLRGTVNSANAGVARATDSSLLTTWCGNTPDSVGVFRNLGGWLIDGSDSGDIGGISNNTWYSIAIDLDAATPDIRLFDSSGSQVGGAEPLPTGSGAWDIGGSAQSGIVDINATSPFNCTAPSGYSAWTL